LVLENEFREPEQWGYEFFLEAGPNHLDGLDTLYYVRSRYSTNDFDRSRRQQEVLLALKDKILSVGTLANPLKVAGLLSEFKNNLRTDIGILDLGDIITLSKSLSESPPTTYVVSTNNLLYQVVEDDIYKLLPTGGNYDQIKLLFANVLLTSPN